jgi:hypothetical protein
VVCPGSIDRLSQSELALLIDNRSLSKLSQGITTEITGEGASAAAQNRRTLAQLQPGLDQYHLKVDWTTLAEYLREWKNRAHRLTSEPTWAHRKSGKQSWGTESRPYTPKNWTSTARTLAGSRSIERRVLR